MDDAHDALVVSIATKRGFISSDVAASAQTLLQGGTSTAGRTIAQELVERGHLTSAQAELLHREAARQHAPRDIGGHRLLGKLGQGGMGAVYRAVQLSLQREVALKVLVPSLAKDQEFVDRFVREARIAGKVIHPNVIACHDVGEDHGVIYMSLELVRGGDALKLCQESGGRLPEAQALALIRDCAKGLGAIHQAGLIHRDIKPSNIFLTEQATAKLADLGLARSVHGDDRLTQTGATVGSPSYMSPEQARGDDSLDIRGDIYSLGASLYHLLVGHPPYTATSVLATIQLVINAPLPDFAAIRPAPSAATLTVLRRTLAKDRDQRYQTPEELAADLERALRGKPARVPTATRSAATAHASHTAHATHTAHTTHTGHAASERLVAARQRRFALGGAVAGTIVAVAVLLAMRPGAIAARPPIDQPRTTGAAETPAPSPARAPATAPVAAPTRVTPATAPPAPADAAPVAPAAPGVPEVVAAPPPAPAPTAAPGSIASAVELDSASPIPLLAAEDAKPSAMPAWSEAGLAALDHLAADRLPEAISAAKPCPPELRAAFAAIEQARARVPTVLAAHRVAIIAAKPVLPLLRRFHGMELAGIDADGLELASADGKASMGVKWAKLDAADRAALEKALPVARLSAAERAIMVGAGYDDLDSVRAAPAGDAIADQLKQLLAIRQAKAEAAAAAAAAEQLRLEEQRRQDLALSAFSADPSKLDAATRTVLRRVVELRATKPLELSGVIDRSVVLEGYVLIRAGTTMGDRGALRPSPGALVVNLAERVKYVPTAIEGIPFISLSVSQGPTYAHRGMQSGLVYRNCIFYGSSLIDSASSPKFVGCAFIGGVLPALQGVRTWDVGQTHAQTVGCDFYRQLFTSWLPIAGSSDCSYQACTYPERPPQKLSSAATVRAWDREGAMQRALAKEPQVPALTVVGLPGRAGTPFAAGIDAIAKALDAVMQDIIKRQ